MQYRSHYKACPRPEDAYHRMTPRIERILGLLDERQGGYRLLRADHIHEFVKYYFSEREYKIRSQGAELMGKGYSEQTTARILRLLMDEGVILRVRSDPDTKTITEGSLSKIYGWNNRKNQAIDERHIKISKERDNKESNEAADTITTETSDEGTKKRREKIKRQDAYSLVPHELGIAESIVWGALLPCRLSQGAMRFLDAPDILESRGSAEAKAAAKPYTWPVEVVYRNKTHKCSITPDRFFGIYLTALAHNWFFLLEQDRSTEPQNRDDYTFNSGTSLFRRFLTYCFLYHTNVLFHLYNIKGFRILFVTDSQTRITHAREIWRLANEALKAFQKQSGIEVRAVPSNVLHCIERPTLRAHDMFSVPWVNGRGDRVTIDIPSTVAPQLSAVG
jgi:hypothetical protein